MPTANTVTLSLNLDQALVFFEWLIREEALLSGSTAHPAEQDVLWVLEGQLEKTLLQPIETDYKERVAEARYPHQRYR